MYPFSF